MKSLLWIISVRNARRHPGLLALAILGIALGVAVTVGVDLANESARRAFALSLEQVTGKATHQIVGGPRGLEEGLYPRLRIDAKVRQSAPVVEGYVQFRGELLQVMGVDPIVESDFRDHLDKAADRGDADVGNRLITEPGAVLVSQTTARRLGLRWGDLLEVDVAGQSVTLHIVGWLRSAQDQAAGLDGLLLADIATAQEIFDAEGRLTRIDLVLPEGEAGCHEADRIRAWLPADVRLERTEGRSETLAQMTRAFRINLTALSLLALLVGMFLIYNTMSFAVLQRRSLLGNLRVLGVTRRQLFELTLGEALAIGLVGTAAGLALGLVLGQGMLGLVTRTVNDLYFVLTVTEYLVTPAPFLKGTLLGLGASTLAALIPSLEAAYSAPRAVQNRSVIEGRAQKTSLWLALAGCVALLWAAALFSLSEHSIVLGFGALFFGILGFALLTPMLVALLARLLSRTFRGSGLASLAFRGLSNTTSRTGVATAALTVAVSASVGVGVMVSSFRATVAHWLDTTLQADIYVSLPGVGSDTGHLSLDPRLVGALTTLPGVDAHSNSRRVTVDSPLGPTRLQAIRFAPQSYQRFLFKEGVPQPLWPAFDRGEVVLVSEPLAYHHALAVGGEIRLRTDHGLRPFRIGGIFYDYGSDQGIVIMSRSLYEHHWEDRGVFSLGLYLTSDADSEAVMATIRQVAAAIQPVRVRSTGQILRDSLDVFDRTFTITRVLRFQVLLVAFVGILSALMALQLERTRELAILRATGFTIGQVRGLVMAQTGFMGLAAGLIALPLGLGIAVALLEVINRRSFGWTIEPLISPTDLTLAVLLAVTAAVLAGLYPGWKMAQTSPAEALREES